MTEKIQSLSICCPAKKCINHCATCTARQHSNPYTDNYSSKSKCATFKYWEDVLLRMKLVRSMGCETLMLTGSNEPQQNRRWLESLFLAMRTLSKPFPNIEMQTTGAFVDFDYLRYLQTSGLTTLAVSTFNIFDDKKNREIEGCADKNLSLKELCDNAYALDLNVRLCINVTDWVYFGDTPSVERLLDRCAELHAKQVTFRKMWSNKGTPEADWIEKNCRHDHVILDDVKRTITEKGTLLKTLPYGASLYGYKGFSIVIDTDSMAKDTTNTAIKYYIIREDGKMYNSWDNPSSLVY